MSKAEEVHLLKPEENLQALESIKVSLNSYAHQDCTPRKLTLQVKQSMGYRKVPAFHRDSEILKTSKIVFSVLA